jgi:hypothetical protein
MSNGHSRGRTRMSPSQRRQMRERAQNSGERDVSNVTTKCHSDQKWKLFYRVKSVTGGQWPTGKVWVHVTTSSGSFGTRQPVFELRGEVSGKLHLNGRHPCVLLFEILTESDEWVAVSNRTATLPRDDRTTIDLEVRKLRWVDFSVKEQLPDGTLRPFRGVALDVTLPGQGKTTVTSRETAFRCARLQDGTASIDEARFEGTWEVLELTSE